MKKIIFIVTLLIICTLVTTALFPMNAISVPVPIEDPYFTEIDADPRVGRIQLEVKGPEVNEDLQSAIVTNTILSIIKFLAYPLALIASIVIIIFVTRKVNRHFNSQEGEDAPLVVKIVCFIIPLVGLILYICFLSKKPKYAKHCGSLALIGFCIPILFGVIAYILSIFSLISNIIMR